MNKKVILVILDGWGLTQDVSRSALAQANTPYMDMISAKYASATLLTSGLDVGLPDGQMGNSEVGHINLGAGRVVNQDFVRINKAIEDKTIQQEKVLINAFQYAKENNKKVHFLGLLSDGGVHSHIKHLEALIDIAETYAVKSYVHAFTDGRDVSPDSGLGYIAVLLDFLKNKKTKLASVIGRYYAMDRDNRWERVKQAYDLLVHNVGEQSTDVLASIQIFYEQDVTDEFIKPIAVCDENKHPIATVAQDDVVIFFNFRTDRGRELTEVLTQKDNKKYNLNKLDLHYVTMTNYDKDFKGIQVIYNKENLKNTLGEVVSKAGLKQIRISETEKYPHVTFFFSGGREQVFEGEKRLLINSPKVATYDLKPEMSAYEVRDTLLPELQNATADLVILNFANGDMVGHTGVFEAVIKAAETVDECLVAVVKTGLKNNYTSIVIADHGNAECMVKPDGSIHTAHTTNPVPLILVDPDRKHIKSGVLANIAPTILEIMGLEKPLEMEESLLR